MFQLLFCIMGSKIIRQIYCHISQGQWVCPVVSIVASICSRSNDQNLRSHYIDVIMGTMASQITSLMVVYSIVYSGADQRKHQSSASLPFVRGNSPGPVNSPHKWPVTRKMFPFDDVIMRMNTRLTHKESMKSKCSTIQHLIFQDLKTKLQNQAEPIGRDQTNTRSAIVVAS